MGEPRFRIYKWNGMWELWQVTKPAPDTTEQTYVMATTQWPTLMWMATRDLAYLAASRLTYTG